jgi:hypothetical protein
MFTALTLYIGSQVTRTVSRDASALFQNKQNKINTTLRETGNSV